MSRGALALLAFAHALSGQILAVSAGASTAYNSQGANLRWRSRGMEATLGIGTIGGRFAVGGALVRSTKDGSITVGEQEIAADLPTDIFENRHSLLGTGIGIRRNVASGSFVAFSGFTSRGSGSPLFNTTSLDQTTHFVQWTTKLTPACKQTLTSAAGHAALGIASFDCAQGRRVHYAFSLGGAYGGAYAAGSYTFESRTLSLKAAYMFAGPHFQRNFSALQPVPEPVRENVSLVYRPTGHWSLQAAHGHYSTQAIEDSSAPRNGANPYRSGLDSVGIQYEQHNLMASVNLLASSYATETTQTQVDMLQGTTRAASAAIRYTLGRFNLSETLMTSHGSTGTKTAIAVTSADVAINSRLRLSESMNMTKDGMSFSHGGSLLTRFSTFEVGYQFFYVANQPAHPFQQALLFRAEVQLPNGLDVQTASSVSPTGQPQYTFQLGRSFSRASSVQSNRVTIGRHIVRGRVEDTSGSGIARAALLIDKDRVYTDTDGFFFYREQKRRTHYLEVLTTEFVAADMYEVHEAPLKVTSTTSMSQLVRVVVQKRERPS